jgi:N-acetyl-gamma-glutamylphosphate reductase
MDLAGADFGVNDNQSWEIRYHAERQRREEVQGHLAYILSELDKLCGLDDSTEPS